MLLLLTLLLLAFKVALEAGKRVFTGRIVALTKVRGDLPAVPTSSAAVKAVCESFRQLTQTLSTQRPSLLVLRVWCNHRQEREKSRLKQKVERALF